MGTWPRSTVIWPSRAVGPPSRAVGPPSRAVGPQTRHGAVSGIRPFMEQFPALDPSLGPVAAPDPSLGPVAAPDPSLVRFSTRPCSVALPYCQTLLCGLTLLPDPAR